MHSAVIDGTALEIIMVLQINTGTTPLNEVNGMQRFERVERLSWSSEASYFLLMFVCANVVLTKVVVCT